MRISVFRLVRGAARALIAAAPVRRVVRSSRLGRIAAIRAALRRYRRRWKIERLFAWLQNFRRLITRHEHEVANFLGFVQLGCIVILLRQYL